MIIQATYSGVMNSRIKNYCNSLFVSILLLMSIKTLRRSVAFYFDYYVGYHLTIAYKHDVFREYMFGTYPEYFEMELKYLAEKKAT